MTYDLRDFIAKLPRLADKLIALTDEARVYLSERREREKNRPPWFNLYGPRGTEFRFPHDPIQGQEVDHGDTGGSK